MSAGVMQVQVLLDRLGFAPGVIDGKGGQSLNGALRGFQKANDLPVTGKVDAATLKLLSVYKATPGTIAIKLTSVDLAGPYVGVLPKGYDKQAKLPTLGYANALEKLSERFHTTPATLIALNSPATRLTPGTSIRVPNVLAAGSDYAGDIKPEWRQTLGWLNVAPQQPTAARVIVDKSDGVLMVLDDKDRLVAQFPATMGSSHDPLPLGTWKIQGVTTNPPFHYNPKLFWDSKASASPQMLKPGPNGPVGVAWLDLSKEHYGIHGTPHPETIGRAESHGCIRLSNWDVARLALMVKAGTPALFRS